MSKDVAAAVGAVMVLAGALAGCTSPSSSAGGSGASTSSATVASPTSAPSGTTPSTGSGTHRPVAPPPESGKPSVAVSTAPPVEIGRTATLTGQVTVSIGAPRAITVAARGPGEVAGPAVAVPVTVRNGSATAFPLGGLVVNAAYSRADTPASPTDADPSKPLRGALAPGASAGGTYVFLAPASALNDLRVEVASDAAARILVFRR